MNRILSKFAEAENKLPIYIQHLFPSCDTKVIKGSNNVLEIYVAKKENQAAKCKCGESAVKLHSTIERVVQDAPWAGFSQTSVHVFIRKFRCPHCGAVFQEAFEWLPSHSRLTTRMMGLIQWELRFGTTISDISKKYQVRWHTIKELDKKQLEHFFTDISLTDLRHLVIDEFAIEKGHSYATVFLNAETGQVVEILKGRSIAQVRPFFERLERLGLTDQVQAVAVDMHAGYHSLVKEYLPNASVVYDLFHVMQHFNKDVLKPAAALSRKLYVQENNKEEKRAFNKLMRGINWILMMPKSELLEKKDAKKKLDEVLEDNALYFVLQPIADLLREVWTAGCRQEAAELLAEVISLLEGTIKEFKFEAVKKFINMLKKRAADIIKACEFKGFGTNVLEGMHNKTKVLKRKGFGYRDFEYFFLKIKSLFPGKNKSFSLWEILEKESVVTKDKIFTFGFSF